jgi:hypothetical protein
MEPICQAFRLCDLKPCAMRCQANQKTCAEHTDFYNISIWKQRFLNLTNKRYLLQGLDYSPNSSMARIQHIIEFSINSENIVLKESDIVAMEYVTKVSWNEPHNSLTDVFTILCGTGKILPKWNKRNLKHAVYNYMKMYTNKALQDCMPPMEKRLGRLLENPATSPRLIFHTTFEYFNMLLLSKESVNWRVSVKMLHEKFIQEALALPQMRSHLLLSDERLVSYFLKPSEEYMMLIRRVSHIYRDNEKLRHKQRMSKHKEGIAMIVWHPDNVERWFRMGGHPLIDMMSGEHMFV